MLIKACDAIDIFDLNKKKEYTLTATCILENVLTNPNLNAQTAKLWQVLFNKAKFNSNLEVKISYAALAKSLHRSCRSISRYVKTLVKEGYLLVDENFSRDGSQQSNTLSVRIPNIVVEEVKGKKDRVVNKVSFSSNNSKQLVTDEQTELTSNKATACLDIECSSTQNQLNAEIKNDGELLTKSTAPIASFIENTISQHPQLINEDLTDDTIGITPNDKNDRGEDDKTVVHKAIINKNKILNNNSVVVGISQSKKIGVLDSEGTTSIQSDMDYDPHTNTESSSMTDEIITNSGVLRETLSKIDNEEDMNKRQIDTLNAKINSLYIKMGSANTLEKINIYEEIRRLQALVTTMTVLINQKNILKPSIHLIDKVDEPSSKERLLSETDTRRIMKGIKSLDLDESDQKRLLNEVSYAIRFGSLRVSQTGQLLSIPHAVNIALKLLREKRWETPTPLQKSSVSSFLYQQNNKPLPVRMYG